MHGRLRARACWRWSVTGGAAGNQRGRLHGTPAVPGARSRGLPFVLKNWRFQQALYRAYYDAYVRSRLLYEEALEERANDLLRQAAQRRAARLGRGGSVPRPGGHPADFAWVAYTALPAGRGALPKPGAHAVERQALPGQEEVRGRDPRRLRFPLNNRAWLKARFAELRQLPNVERLAGIGAILDWTNPGPGGFYDDLSRPWEHSHLATTPRSPMTPTLIWTGRCGVSRIAKHRARCDDHGELSPDRGTSAPSRCVTPVWIPRGATELRMVYSCLKPHIPVRLTAAGGIEIHPFLARNDPPARQ